MFYFAKSIIAASALIATAGTAAANDEITAKFNYNPSDSVETIYVSFEKTAEKACRVNPRDVGGISMKMKIEASCTAELIEGAVAATKMDTLVAYHEQLTEPTKRVRRFASVD